MSQINEKQKTKAVLLIIIIISFTVIALNSVVLYRLG
jgi:hypothetical protein